MAWSEVLQTLLGMQDLAQRRGENSRDRRQSAIAMRGQAMSDIGNSISDMFTNTTNTIVGLQKDKLGREFASGEAEKQRGFETSEREAVQEFQQEAERTNNTYEYEYKHPWDNSEDGGIKLKNDGNPQQFQFDLARIRQYDDYWNSIMQEHYAKQGAERASESEDRGVWTEAMQTGRGELYLRLQQAGLMDPNTFMPLGDMEDPEFASKFNDVLNSVLTDDLMSALLSDYGLEQTPENIERLRGLIEKEAQAPITIEETEPDQGRKRRSFMDVAGNPADLIGKIGPAIRDARERIGSNEPPQGIGDIADEFSGASLDEAQALAEAERQSITEDFQGGAQRLQTVENPDIQGMWEQQMLKDIMSVEAQATPEDMAALQSIYDLIAGKGKWEEQGKTRSDWKNMLDAVNALVEKYK